MKRLDNFFEFIGMFLVWLGSGWMNYKFIRIIIDDGFSAALDAINIFKWFSNLENIVDFLLFFPFVFFMFTIPLMFWIFSLLFIFEGIDFIRDRNMSSPRKNYDNKKKTVSPFIRYVIFPLMVYLGKVGIDIMLGRTSNPQEGITIAVISTVVFNVYLGVGE